MPETTTTQPDVQTQADLEAPATGAEEALVEESLVEEVSIDGMCGVY
jgi:mycofactocin precursor peptide MftA